MTTTQTFTGPATPMTQLNHYTRKDTYMNTRLIGRNRGRTLDRRTTRLSGARRLTLALLSVVMLFGAIGTAAVTNVGPQAVRDVVVDAGPQAVKDALVQEAEAFPSYKCTQWFVYAGYWGCYVKDYSWGLSYWFLQVNRGYNSHPHGQCIGNLAGTYIYECTVITEGAYY